MSVARTRTTLFALLTCAVTATPLVARQDEGRRPYCLPVRHEQVDLTATLSAVRERHNQPAMAAAVFSSDEIIEINTVGVTRGDRDDAREVTVDDAFHIGSCTKAVTALMIATLVEEGVLWWDMPLEQALPDLAPDMDEDFKAVTLTQLLRHRAGIASYTDGNKPEFQRVRALTGTPMEQREALARLVLTAPPAERPGTRFVYSNAGYGIAAAIAEHATGKSWEELVRNRVFGPLGMDRAGFGWPATVEKPDAVMGHVPTGTVLMPLPVSHPYRIPAALAPSGDIHCSIRDLTAFAQANLAGIRGANDLISHKNWMMLHQPEGEYAMGWVGARRGDGQISWHNGSAGTFFALMTLDPDLDCGVVVMSNSGNGEAACQELSRRLLAQHAPRDEATE